MSGFVGICEKYQDLAVWECPTSEERAYIGRVHDCVHHRIPMYSDMLSYVRVVEVTWK